VTGLLASVTSAAEARAVHAAGADVIDLKDPRRGALGALPAAVIGTIVAALDGRCVLSATIGDDAECADVRERVQRTAALGVDFVKVGLGGARREQRSLLAVLGTEAARGTALVAVLFADRERDATLVARCADAGLRGVMLDTADKRAGGLRRLWSDVQLGAFVAAARRARLLVGLAGSLGIDDVDPLLALAPDYLGFRGALCRAGERRAGIDPGALRALRARIPKMPAWTMASAAVQAAGGR